ncbi:MAG: phosphate acyltransferase [Candidatus Zixiibacteriota bacterium]
MEQITTFEQLVSHMQAEAKKNKIPRAAYIGLPDVQAVKMMAQASRDKIAKSIVLYNKEECSQVLLEAEVDDLQLPVIHADSIGDACAQAVKMLAGGQIEYLILGEKYIDAFDILAANGFVPHKRSACHVAVFEHEKYPRLLLLSDGFVTPAPDLVGKMDIIGQAVGVAHRLGVETPKVAVTAAVEVVYPVMDVTKDAAVLAKMSDRRQIKGCIVDGPLSMDCATVPEVAKDKGVVSPVAGVADVLIAPNVETGNGIYKAMSLVAKAKTAGVIVGGKCPVALMANCDGPDNVYYSLALTSLLTLG